MRRHRLALCKVDTIVSLVKGRPSKRRALGRDGSIDWLCLLRFDSGACFAALLGDERHGRRRIAPAAAATAQQRYRPGTLVLETDFTCADCSARVVDCEGITSRRRTGTAVVAGIGPLRTAWG